MTTELIPEVGGWYRRLDIAQPFQVVAADFDDGTVEVEYFDGTVDEWPLSHWQELDIEACGAPPDVRGALDETDDESAAAALLEGDPRGGAWRDPGR